MLPASLARVYGHNGGGRAEGPPETSADYALPDGWRTEAVNA